VPELGKNFRAWVKLKRNPREGMRLFVLRHRQVLNKVESSLNETESGDSLSKKLRDMIDKNKLTIIDCFYSMHFFSQIQMLLFFYCPKILLNLFLGKLQADNLRDSNELLSEAGHSLLSIAKKALIGVSFPFAILGFKETCMRKNSDFAAGNLHLLLISKSHEADSSTKCNVD
jgi:hypothetical protein